MLVANTVVSKIDELNPNVIHDGGKDNPFKDLFRSCVYGICLRLKQHVLATHQELSILRSCADMMREQSPRLIHVVAGANRRQTRFIVDTLIHLGVSCGQIKVNSTGPIDGGEQDVWIFVTEGRRDDNHFAV